MHVVNADDPSEDCGEVWRFTLSRGPGACQGCGILHGIIDYRPVYQQHWAYCFIHGVICGIRYSTLPRNLYNPNLNQTVTLPTLQPKVRRCAGYTVFTCAVEAIILCLHWIWGVALPFVCVCVCVGLCTRLSVRHVSCLLWYFFSCCVFVCACG